MARRRTGLSQETFAADIGITRRHQIRLENGEHRPTVEVLSRIADRAGVDADSFGYPVDDDEEESLHEAFGLFRDLMATLGSHVGVK